MTREFHVKLTDCTLRDGGYVNGHSFTSDQVLHTLNGLLESGVDLIEVGYFRRDGKPAGLTGHCPDSLLESLPLKHRDRIAVMLKPASVAPIDVAALRDTAVSVVRIPVQSWNVTEGIALAEAAHENGLLVSLNIIRVSELSHEELQYLLRQVFSGRPDVVYLADSNGSLHPTRVEALVRYASQLSNVPIGFHAHDNLTFAVANSLSAIKGGASWVDSTIGGLGKGGGNAPTETMLPLLSHMMHREIRLDSVVHILDAFPGDLFPPRMRERLKSILYGLYDINMDQILSMESTSSSTLHEVDTLHQHLLAHYRRSGESLVPLAATA